MRIAPSFRRLQWRIRLSLLLLVTTACSERGSVSGNGNAADLAPSPPTSPAQSAQNGAASDRAYDPGGPTEPSPRYTDAAVPETGSKCHFEERDPAERPAHFIPASHSSNIIFYQRPKGPLWSDIDPKGAIAELEPTELIVADRHEKPDLWIRSKGGRVTLQVGKRLTCY